MRRLIEESLGHEEGDNGVVDEAVSRTIEAPPGDDQEQRPRVEPSSLLDTRNEWRDEEETSGR